MGGNNTTEDNEEKMCNSCKRKFTGQAIKSLGGQMACCEQCADRLQPLYEKDFCYGCKNIVWEFSYLTLRGEHIFCNLECLSKYLSTEELPKNQNVEPKTNEKETSTKNDSIEDKIEKQSDNSNSNTIDSNDS